MRVNRLVVALALMMLTTPFYNFNQVGASSNVDYDSGWEIEVINNDINTTGGVLAVDKYAIPHVLFHDNDNSSNDIYHASRQNESWIIEKILSAGGLSPQTFVFDSNNHPHIITERTKMLYHYYWNGDTWLNDSIVELFYGASHQTIVIDQSDGLYIAYDDDGLVFGEYKDGRWEIERVTNNELIEYISISLDSLNQPHICYYLFENWDTNANGDLKYAHRYGSKWIVETVESYGIVGQSNSIIVDSNNNPHIVYSSQNGLKYAQRQNNSWMTIVIDPLGGFCPSTDIDHNDNIHISYRDYDEDKNLEYIKYSINRKGNWIIYTIDQVSTNYGVGGGTSLQLDSLERPHLCYGGADIQRVIYAHYVNGDYDEDGYIDDNDAFPKDPAVSKDSDNDGYPNRWNEGKSENDSTTGLTLDAFPDDPEEWDDTDSDGVGDNSDVFPDDPDEWEDTDNDSIGDNSDAFPEDPSASIDADEDGLPDSWNDGFGPEDSTSDPPLVIDMYPDDPDNIPPDDDEDDDSTDDDDTSGSESDAMGILLIVGLMAAIIAVVLFFFRKRDDEIEDEQPPPT